jgi:hypothetical protein
MKLKLHRVSPGRHCRQGVHTRWLHGNALALLLVSCATQAPAQQLLQPLPCSQEGTIRSDFLGFDTLRSIHFNNLTCQTLQIFWLNYDGQRELYSVLEPGTSYVQGSYLTHLWLVADLNGACLGIYLPIDGTAEARLLNPPSQALGCAADQIGNLVSAGVLEAGLANALTSKLEAARQQLDRGNVRAAINQLGALINQVNASMQAGDLSSPDGTRMIGVIAAIIESLGG